MGGKRHRGNRLKTRNFEELHKLNQRHTITWIWVKGHNGHPENERCDELANEAIAEL